MNQLGHYETLERMPALKSDCVLFACGISCENLGLILRSADIFGVNTVYYYKGASAVNDGQLARVSRNADVSVYVSAGLETLLGLRGCGYQLAALEITDTSIPLRFADFERKICLIVGNERGGVPEDILKFGNYVNYCIRII
jgi:tRNA G18 (ribose-2'-O)-methylase SpoU